MQTSTDTSNQTRKTALRRHFDEVLNQGRLEVIDEIYSDDYLLDAPFSSDGTARPHAVTSGREGLKKRVTLFRTAFPDILFTVAELIGEGESVAARYQFEGTHLGAFGDLEATGRTMRVTGALVAHFRDGQIYEAFSAFDSGDIIRQLEVPVPSA